MRLVMHEKKSQLWTSRSVRIDSQKSSCASAASTANYANSQALRWRAVFIDRSDASGGRLTSGFLSFHNVVLLWAGLVIGLAMILIVIAMASGQSAGEREGPAIPQIEYYIIACANVSEMSAPGGSASTTRGKTT
jgi:hypothetical protein